MSDPKMCESQFMGYRCTLAEGHAGLHCQQLADGAHFQWSTVAAEMMKPPREAGAVGEE